MTAVTPLLTHWSYCSLALSHRYRAEFVAFLIHAPNPMLVSSCDNEISHYQYQFSDVAAASRAIFDINGDRGITSVSFSGVDNPAALPPPYENVTRNLHLYPKRVPNRTILGVESDIFNRNISVVSSINRTDTPPPPYDPAWIEGAEVIGAEEVMGSAEVMGLPPQPPPYETVLHCETQVESET